MLQVTLFVEFLRSRPQLAVWAMALLQAALWTLVPALFFSAPPGQLPESIAVGHEYRLASHLGPPLAHWLADAAYGLGRFWVYLLSQACVVTTYWAVFQLGTAIVGPRHAAIAVVLMGGIFLFTIPTPEFGPAILAMALWAVALLHFWRAAEENRPLYWPVLGLELGLLLLTTYAAFVFIALLLAYLMLSERGRAKFADVGPWIAGIIIVFVVFPLLLWLDHPRGAALTPAAISLEPDLLRGLRVLGWLLAAHLGCAILIALGFETSAARREARPSVDRAPVDPAARVFVYFFALAPAATMTLFAMVVGGPAPIPIAPLAVLSGLSVMVAAPDRLPLAHQRLAGYAWATFVILPPLLAIFAIAGLPWIFPMEMAVGRPAAEMGRFFGESFERRTGRPLEIVTGDAETAALVALAAPSRPRLYFDGAPERTPWINRADIDAKGAVVVWPSTDASGAPPPSIRARFPDLVPDVPRTFSRLVQGRLPPVRIGWGVIRPLSAAIEIPSAPPPPPQIVPSQPPVEVRPAPEPPPPPAPPQARKEEPLKVEPRASPRPPPPRRPPPPPQRDRLLQW
ncbi:MAG TPA: glycosyltransferase family 39 protein [Xanthobacteraceae bacterium]|nr:glycosyltransferase family 39 protein [Xanthobacteraceae bacterium]